MGTVTAVCTTELRTSASASPVHGPNAGNIGGSKIIRNAVKGFLRWRVSLIGNLIGMRRVLSLFSPLPRPVPTAGEDCARLVGRSGYATEPRHATMLGFVRRLLSFGAVFLPLRLLPAEIDVPVSGVRVPELDYVDTVARVFMTNNEISGALIGIMRNGSVIYQRGIGWKDEARSILMPENALVRIASCTKPFTAVAIRQLIDEGRIALTNYVYDLGQPGGGILHITPFGGTAGRYHTNITVQHCLEHTAGWDDEKDPYGALPFSDCELADWMGGAVTSLIGVEEKIAWLLSRDLYYEPGTCQEYANEGYLVLGRIVELVSGMDLVSYHRRHVLTPSMWIPATDLKLGRALATNQDRREAWYDGKGVIRSSNYATDGYAACDPANLVPIAYGGRNHETMVGSGSLIATAATMLELAQRYQIKSESSGIGLPQTNPPQSGMHGGRLNGTNTRLAQRSDRINVFIFFNANDPNGHYAVSFYDDFLSDFLNSNTAWPTLCVAGFWVNPDGTSLSKYGSYNEPFADLDDALDNLVDGSRVNFLPGNSDWTGTISTKLLLRAPLGTARIGIGP